MSRPNILNDNQRKEILNKSFYGLIDKHELAKSYDVSLQTIEREIRKLNLTHAKKHLIIAARKYLTGEKVKDISHELRISQVAINAFFRRRKIPQRNTTYISDFNFFECVDSEEKAYWLGFIVADGCIYKNSLSITLAKKDLSHLEKFKASMKSNKPISAGVARGFGNFETCNITITHKKLKYDLAALGVLPRKTENCIFPKLEEPLVKHFIRGYFDGDGSVGRYTIASKQKTSLRCTLNICGTMSFLVNIRTIFTLLTGCSGSVSKRHKFTASNIVALCYSGNRAVKKILNYMYVDSSVYLDRKYKKYLDICL